MMQTDNGRLTDILTASTEDAWKLIMQRLWSTFSAPLSVLHPEEQIAQREMSVGAIELLLSGSAWELWNSFEKNVPRAAQSIASFWASNQEGKAVLLLDGLSLREVPWLLQEAAKRGFSVTNAGVRGSEIPSDTTSFAKALGFTQRSQLENNGASATHSLKGARTESLSAAWDYCHDWISAYPDIVLWHHWPDDRIHHLAEPGDGLQKLCREMTEQLTSDQFWALIERMATGRRLVITSDHGYAASGVFTDVGDKEQATWLKAQFGSSRFAHGIAATDHWVPPLSLCLETVHGVNTFALGRRKWRSSGGYPTLAHGGLSLLEVAVPFIELSRS